MKQSVLVFDKRLKPAFDRLLLVLVLERLEDLRGLVPELAVHLG